MTKEYTEVRKVKWDALWHAVWITPDGREAWDRVSPLAALRIAYEYL